MLFVHTRFASTLLSVEWFHSTFSAFLITPLKKICKKDFSYLCAYSHVYHVIYVEVRGQPFLRNQFWGPNSLDLHHKCFTHWAVSSPLISALNQALWSDVCCICSLFCCSTSFSDSLFCWACFCIWETGSCCMLPTLVSYMYSSCKELNAGVPCMCRHAQAQWCSCSLASSSEPDALHSPWFDSLVHMTFPGGSHPLLHVRIQLNACISV